MVVHGRRDGDRPGVADPCAWLTIALVAGVVIALWAMGLDRLDADVPVPTAAPGLDPGAAQAAWEREQRDRDVAREHEAAAQSLRAWEGMRR